MRLFIERDYNFSEKIRLQKANSGSLRSLLSGEFEGHPGWLSLVLSFPKRKYEETNLENNFYNNKKIIYQEKPKRLFSQKALYKDHFKKIVLNHDSLD